jgi:hypothetical protein
MTTTVHRTATLSDVPAAIPHAAPIEGEWVRLPLPGQRLEGLCRSGVYDLIRAGAIRSHCLRKRGAVRGIRLIHLPSLREYIENSALLNP